MIEPDPARCFTIRAIDSSNLSDKIGEQVMNVCAPTILDKNKMVEYLKIVY